MEILLTMVVILFVIPVGVYCWWSHRKFHESSYYAASGNGFFQTIRDKGIYGEYLTYRILERSPGYKKLLANVYLPKADGGTTEVDVIMLSEAGVFVFESKNYSGWLYGDEKSQLWTQVLHQRAKFKFFNPIWQNLGHIDAVRRALADAGLDDSLFRSYIVFSERCTLAKVTTTSPDVLVLKRGDLKRQLYGDVRGSMGAMTPEGVGKAYELLHCYAHADQGVKDAHVSAIEMSGRRRRY